VYVMVRPETGVESAQTLPMFSVMIAILGAFGSSIAYVSVRKLSQTEDSSVIIFYFPLVALPTSILFMRDNFVMPDLYLT
ncbi:EamA/RhaT family transporter, partial [Vibrio sp. Vb0877]|nr:EamA/RhaT family transporter [Vibrio sp. Vb0877]